MQKSNMILITKFNKEQIHKATTEEKKCNDQDITFLFRVQSKLYNFQLRISICIIHSCNTTTLRT